MVTTLHLEETNTKAPFEGSIIKHRSAELMQNEFNRSINILRASMETRRKNFFSKTSDIIIVQYRIKTGSFAKEEN